jgi:hypothetical protein
MTEEQWLNAMDPHPLLQYLRSKGNAGHRKLLLWACACVRRIWPLLADCRSRDAVETRERYEDGLASQGELAVAKKVAGNARNEALAPYRDIAGSSVNDRAREFGPVWAALAASALADGNPDSIVMAAWATGCLGAEWQAAYRAERAAQATVFRDVFFGPFRPVPHPGEALLTGNGGLVARLAQAVYGDPILPAGTLDPARLAVLGDALEEVGCTDAEILGHLRGAGQHWRGCWCVDLLTGRQ